MIAHGNIKSLTLSRITDLYSERWVHQHSHGGIHWQDFYLVWCLRRSLKSSVLCHMSLLRGKIKGFSSQDSWTLPVKTSKHKRDLSKHMLQVCCISSVQTLNFLYNENFPLII